MTTVKKHLNDDPTHPCEHNPNAPPYPPLWIFRLPLAALLALTLLGSACQRSNNELGQELDEANAKLDELAKRWNTMPANDQDNALLSLEIETRKDHLGAMVKLGMMPEAQANALIGQLASLANRVNTMSATERRANLMVVSADNRRDALEIKTRAMAVPTGKMLDTAACKVLYGGFVGKFNYRDGNGQWHNNVDLDLVAGTGNVLCALTVSGLSSGADMALMEDLKGVGTRVTEFRFPFPPDKFLFQRVP